MSESLDFSVDVLHESTGQPKEWLRRQLTSQPPEWHRAFEATFSKEEAREKLRAWLGQVAGHLRAHPEQADAIMTAAGDTRDAQTRARDEEFLASYRLKEAQAKRGVTAQNPRGVRNDTPLKNVPDHLGIGRTQDDEAALLAFIAYVDTLPIEVGELLSLSLRTLNGQMDALGAGRWVDQACPIIRLAGHKYAAALMSTAIPKQSDIPLHFPWAAFLVEVPLGLLSTMNASGQEEGIQYILTFQQELRGSAYVNMSAFGTTVRLTRFGLTMDQFCDETFRRGREEDVYGLCPDNRDDRTLQLVTRAVVNTCLAAAEMTPLGKHPSGWTRGPLRHAKAPTFRSFRVGKPVAIDCREALADYVSGKRRNPLAVQFLVRGHWRNQAHGAQLEKRKIIWIEPYWKGPEDALIQRREHSLGEGA